MLGVESVMISLLDASMSEELTDDERGEGDELRAAFILAEEDERGDDMLCRWLSMDGWRGVLLIVASPRARKPDQSQCCQI